MDNAEFYKAGYIITVMYPSQFRTGFADWLYDNVDIAQAFEAEALAVAATGRKRYSAYTIIEYLRHWTFLREASSEFKLDQNWGSSLARLFIHMHPDLSGFMPHKNERRGRVAPLRF